MTAIHASLSRSLSVTLCHSIYIHICNDTSDTQVYVQNDTWFPACILCKLAYCHCPNTSDTKLPSTIKLLPYQSRSVITHRSVCSPACDTCAAFITYDCTYNRSCTYSCLHAYNISLIAFAVYILLSDDKIEPTPSCSEMELPLSFTLICKT